MLTTNYYKNRIQRLESLRLALIDAGKRIVEAAPRVDTFAIEDYRSLYKVAKSYAFSFDVACYTAVKIDAQTACEQFRAGNQQWAKAKEKAKFSLDRLSIALENSIDRESNDFYNNDFEYNNGDIIKNFVFRVFKSNPAEFAEVPRILALAFVRQLQDTKTVALGFDSKSCVVDFYGCDDCAEEYAPFTDVKPLTSNNLEKTLESVGLDEDEVSDYIEFGPNFVDGLYKRLEKYFEKELSEKVEAKDFIVSNRVVNYASEGFKTRFLNSSTR